PFMPPEQFEGDPAKVRHYSDIYSLGVLLYNCLSARLPFEGPDHLVAGKILTGNPMPLNVFVPDIDPILVAICHKSIAKEPETRFASMREFADHLALYMSRQDE